MIRRPTVLILGAGASVPYGFPTGTKLISQIMNGLKPDANGLANRGFAVDVRLALNRQTPGVDEPTAFHKVLAEAAPPSIDHFLQNNPGFRDIGKVCIVRALIPQEIPRLPGPGADQRQNSWVRYLVHQMLARGVNRFGDNRVSVITFNFDRSFEHHIHQELRHNVLALGPDGAAELIRDNIEIVHVHGELGGAAWLCSDSPFSRGYEPHCDAEIVAKCAAQIRIISDEIAESPQAKRASELIDAASILCFLGFGFHQFNLDRLALPRSMGKTRKCWATCMGLAPGLRSEMESVFTSRINFVDDNVYNFLMKMPWMHE